MPKEWDVFISHASEDKRTVVLALAEALRWEGLRVWLDRSELTLGDSLRERINVGLSRSRYGIVILSRGFLAKRWPRNELNAMLAREEEGRKVVLPVRYAVTQEEVAAEIPLVADRLSVSFDDGVDQVVAAILHVVGRPERSARGTVAIDMSLRQDKWQHLSSFVEGWEPSLWKISAGVQEEAEILEQCAALIVPPPYHESFTRPELDKLEAWVDAGGGLLILGYYAWRHHASNFRELAWRFDLDFGDDLVMSEDASKDDARAQVFSRDPRLAVKVSQPSGSHPVLAGVCGAKERSWPWAPGSFAPWTTGTTSSSWITY